MFIQCECIKHNLKENIVILILNPRLVKQHTLALGNPKHMGLRLGRRHRICLKKNYLVKNAGQMFNSCIHKYIYIYFFIYIYKYIFIICPFGTNPMSRPGKYFKHGVKERAFRRD